MMKWRPVRTFAKLQNGFPFSSEDFADTGDLPVVRIRDLGDAPFQTFIDRSLVPDTALLRNGLIVIGMDGNFNVRLWDRGEAALNQRVCALEALPNSDPRFVAYALPQPLREINELTYSTTVKHLSGGQILRVKLPDCSFAEQKAIADFLDRETSQIDAMIEAQESLAAAASERRFAVIHHYVTKGLNPDAPQAPSSMEWLGNIPSHWKVDNIRRHALMKTGHTPRRSTPAYWLDCGIPWITLADVWQLRSGQIEYIEKTDEMISDYGLENSAAELLPAGTVVLSRTASVGFSGIMASPMATSQDYWNWVCKPSLVPEYLLYVFRAMEQEFKALRQGSTHQTIYQPIVAGFRIPVPPVEEQHQIVTELRATLHHTYKLLDEITTTTDLLRERREALITAAVTGRIDPHTGIERVDHLNHSTLVTA